MPLRNSTIQLPPETAQSKIKPTMSNEQKEEIVQECFNFIHNNPDVPSEWLEMKIQSLFGLRLAKHGLSAREVCQRYRTEIDE
jgi:hypothetical protein